MNEIQVKIREEVAADTWLATLALLCYHSQQLDTEVDSSQELWWPLTPTDQTYYLLADHLPLRSEMSSYPDGGLMARITHLPTLLKSLLPLWQDRLQYSTLGWSGMLALSLDDQISFLEFGSMGISHRWRRTVKLTLISRWWAQAPSSSSRHWLSGAAETAWSASPH
ncbi:MAG TPA: hypothetical protein VFZ02_13715 [Ktedonobacteraceae bacterium]